MSLNDAEAAADERMKRRMKQTKKQQLAGKLTNKSCHCIGDIPLKSQTAGTFEITNDKKTTEITDCGQTTSTKDKQNTSSITGDKTVQLRKTANTVRRVRPNPTKWKVQYSSFGSDIEEDYYIAFDEIGCNAMVV